jgi:hypothetical protein
VGDAAIRMSSHARPFGFAQGKLAGLGRPT